MHTQPPSFYIKIVRNIYMGLHTFPQSNIYSHQLVLMCRLKTYFLLNSDDWTYNPITVEIVV